MILGSLAVEKLALKYMVRDEPCRVSFAQPALAGRQLLVCMGVVHEQLWSSVWEGYGLGTPIKMGGWSQGNRCCSPPSPSPTLPLASPAPGLPITTV